MTPSQIQLARRRLWLGITNVGFWVLLSAVGVLWLQTVSAGEVRFLVCVQTDFSGVSEVIACEVADESLAGSRNGAGRMH